VGRIQARAELRRRCSGGGAVEEWRVSRERCEMERELGLAFYRAERGRGRGGRGGGARSVAGAINGQWSSVGRPGGGVSGEGRWRGG
jgi:hypothetical protein